MVKTPNILKPRFSLHSLQMLFDMTQIGALLPVYDKLLKIIENVVTEQGTSASDWKVH